MTDDEKEMMEMLDLELYELVIKKSRAERLCHSIFKTGYELSSMDFCVNLKNDKIGMLLRSVPDPTYSSFLKRWKNKLKKRSVSK